ncbi:MAG: hypothetical protein IKV04_00415 [Alistipes sp.]|nr:hypothetical protein [Alistipes sp.]
MTLQNQHSERGNNLGKVILRASTAAILAIFLIFSTGEVSAQGAPVKLKVVNASYDYSLAPQGGNTYGPWNMLDGNIATAWAVSLDNPYIIDGDMIYGPYFKLSCKKLSHIVIRNGYAKSASAYINNSRASYIYFEVETSDGLEGFGASLKDTPDPQRLNAPLNESWNNNIKTIQMVFPYGNFIKGAKWNDLCITEIEFWGWR